MTASSIIRNLPYEMQQQGSSRFSFPHFIDFWKTIEKLKGGKFSISRYGDGEFKIMSGESLRFQKFDPQLATRLAQVLKSNVNQHLIGIPSYFFSLKEYPRYTKRYLRRFLMKHRASMLGSLDFNKTYYDTSISQYYALTGNHFKLTQYFDGLRSIWHQKEIVIVKGKDSETDQQYNIYDNASSVGYVLVPSKHAFSNYACILRQLQEQPKDRMLLLALGPTATVLAHDLCIFGYRALDLGHLAKSYDWFKKGKIIGEDKDAFFPV